MARYIAYYRVSTAKQGRSGLGLAAQQDAIKRFLGDNDELIGEYQEVESGKKDERTALWKALAHAKREKAKLVIARLDRFSRRVSFIARIMDEGVQLVVAEMPNATDFQLHIFAALAQEERRLISERTRAALCEAKKRGAKLGTNGRVLAERNRQKADQFVKEIRAFLGAQAISAGYSEIARILNSKGFKTRSGRAFYPQTVKNYWMRELDRDLLFEVYQGVE
jgi:DNA invertase Pin-like site-specific DNA recombinase